MENNENGVQPQFLPPHYINTHGLPMLPPPLISQNGQIIPTSYQNTRKKFEIIYDTVYSISTLIFQL